MRRERRRGIDGCYILGIERASSDISKITPQGNERGGIDGASSEKEDRSNYSTL